MRHVRCKAHPDTRQIIIYEPCRQAKQPPLSTGPSREQNGVACKRRALFVAV